MKKQRISFLHEANKTTLANQLRQLPSAHAHIYALRAEALGKCSFKKGIFSDFALIVKFSNTFDM